VRIGLAIARVFLAERDRATISGLGADEISAALTELGPRATGMTCDLTGPDQALALADHARAIAPVDILINNVGIFEVRPLLETTDSDWFRFFDVNVMTWVRMSRLLMQDILARGEGSIVFISSEGAIKPQAWMLHYGAMKTCLVGLSRALVELTRGAKVRVNSILPGPTATAAVSAYHSEIAAEKGISRDEVVARYFDEIEPTSLIRRMLTPEEVASSVLHLASSPHLNGMAMRAEGGTIHSIV
jgi:NAD(P)-dependent dehydrogenase (short-subunit alcohol dehydrogenase family)